ncbi:hypothetical protein K8R61_00530 [bacterium]|nr:hypothetical protein [bacterium]
MKKIFFTILFSFLFLLFSATQVLASDLVISNPEQKINISPEGAGHFTLFVKNNSDKVLVLETKIKSFRVVGDEGGIELFDDNKNIFINLWLKQQTPSSFELQPGKRSKVVFLISVPLIAENKGYYASIYFVGHQKDEVLKKFESNKSRILLGVESQHDNSLIRNGELEEFLLHKFASYGPVEFVAKFKNNGKIHYKTKGQIEVYNLFDQRVATIQLKEKNILPNSSLYFNCNWNPKFLFGKYLVIAEMIDGDGKITVKSKEFFAFPWKGFLEIIVIITLIIIARKLRIKKIKFE